MFFQLLLLLFIASTIILSVLFFIYIHENKIPTLFQKPMKINGIATIRKENGNVYLDKPTISTDGFKVLLLTDLHLTFVHNLTRWTLSGVIGHINREKPDLVIINGDINESFSSNKRYHAIAKILEEFGVAWGFTLGNHDVENDISMTRETLVRSLLSYKHCVMTLCSKDVDGFSNYAVHITNGSNVIRSFIMLDSGDYISDENAELYDIDKNTYDFIKPSQIDFYEKIVVEQRNQNNGITVPSSLVFHIPIPEFKVAFEQGELIYGNKREKICSPFHNSGLFERIENLGSTDNIYTGHDHTNDFSVDYKGIRFTYIQKSGYSLFSRKSKSDLVGCTVVNIFDDGSLRNQQFFSNDYPEIFNGLRKINIFGF